jgi:hypothetical protein
MRKCGEGEDQDRGIVYMSAVGSAGASVGGGGGRWWDYHHHARHRRLGLVVAVAVVAIASS